MIQRLSGWIAEQAVTASVGFSMVYKAPNELSLCRFDWRFCRFQDLD
jgi:hypothetical protein